MAIGPGLTLLSHTTGSQGQYNTAVGLGCLPLNSTGSFNIGLGTSVLSSNTTGSDNAAVGHGALSLNIAGSDNTAFGHNTLYNNTGSYNVATGVNALINKTSGDYNTAIGSSSLTGASGTSGSNNTALGYSAASNISGSASSNIAIGYNALLPTPGGSNQLNLGNILFGTGLTGTYSAPAGKIGIGTNAPGSLLDVKGIFTLSGATSGSVTLSAPTTGGAGAYTLPSADGSSGQQLTTNGTGGLSWGSVAGITTNLFILSGSYLTSTVNGVTNSVTLPWSTSGANISNSNTGAVIIGSVSTPAGYKLYVSTGILTEKIKAALKTSANWSDFVFESHYKLKPIEDVEKYIKANKHLPDVPSADELVKEGGIDMNEMFAKQMQKIEELTLYIIDMKKEIKDLQAQNVKLKSSKGDVNK